MPLAAIAEVTMHLPDPATKNPKHLTDNVAAGVGKVPDARLRRRMMDELGFA